VGAGGAGVLFGDGAREIVYSVTMAADHLAGDRMKHRSMEAGRDRREIFHAGESG